jgi:diguanylate cyclase (GGDEF)-like protein
MAMGGTCHVLDLESGTFVLTAAAPPILLAEDDPVTRMLLARSLKKAGYLVEAVGDGLAALEHMQQQYYPILITDWEMPGMDGVALCRAVRRLPLDGYVYMLLLTARDAKEQMVAGLEAGADDYLIKPVHEPELFARLNTGRRILNLEHSLRAANERNRLLAITDPLTGAYNRRQLMAQLPRELERCRRYAVPLAVIVCDIDYFKNVNDRHGHAIGDEILRQFVARIQASIRGGSDWVARCGGEEFTLVLPETDLAGGVVTAEKIRALISGTTFQTDVGPVSVTASFGVAATSGCGPDPGTDFEALIAAADIGLYRSKRAGRDRVTTEELGVALRPSGATAR